MTTTGDIQLTGLSSIADDDCSTLITISTQDCVTPICRLGNSRDILGTLTVRHLIERVVSPNSLLSIHVPISQLEAETPTALAVSELLKTSCDVFLEGDPGGDRLVPLDDPAATITQAQMGAQGSSFLNISLSVRPASDGARAGEKRQLITTPEFVEVATLQEPQAPPVEERREVALPEVVEVVRSEAPADDPLPIQDPTQPMLVEKIEEIFADQEDEPIAKAPMLALGASQPDEPMASEPESREPPGEKREAASPGIVAIVAERPARQPRSTASTNARKEYIRKSDWLRAQFLPEIQALDFSGLFVGNLGMGVREEQSRRRVVLADPARITDVLLRGNSFRRTGDHAKALICYQELVDMDPGNADFRFLLGKTLLELGQHGEGVESLNRAKELGHEGARKELEMVKTAAPRPRSPLGFLKFWRT